jgi:NhaP-type Na+/H+ or K+/H+ antiporter
MPARKLRRAIRGPRRSQVLMQGRLPLLLFAGALHSNLRETKDYRRQIGVFAVLGTLL